MKIVLLGNRDISSNVALSLLITAMPQHRYAVMLSEPPAQGSAAVAALAQLSSFEQQLCDALPGTPSLGSGRVMSFSEVADRTDSEVRTLAQPNSPEGLALLAGVRPDLVISVRYRGILRDTAIGIPRYGVLNLHSGLLPQYKGMMATFWAMLNNEPAIGSSLHYIVDRTIDTGPVIERAAVPVDRTRSYLANVLSLYPAGCRMVVEAVHRIERGETVVGHAQEVAGRYYSVPGADDVSRFTAAGMTLFEGNELPVLLHELDAAAMSP